MSLIELKDIGKIYVSGNNVAVGIRGVNLSFDRGEFVAVTGKSGSGKSTLLNIISGMDTYEEGEMLFNGEPTSHYIQQDWEEYRRKYISFIFQDYNIIESFTVLENVELALMNIEDTKLRRERALELLRRVGLEQHIYHKGSKLSGGQKQRTVIARALAKDSPVILADEPTGNLDSSTSAEIIELLREVSKDKLVIVVTHNFEQVAGCATRHIRIFDGAVESDQTFSSAAPVSDNNATANADMDTKSESSGKKTLRRIRDGLTLGRTRFCATPKLSVFICVLMILSALALTLVTSLNGDAALGLFDKNYIFTHKDGRVIVIRQNGAIITDDELNALAAKVGAKSVLHYDFLLDSTEYVQIGSAQYSVAFSYGDFDGIDAGRAPEKEDEVMLRVPVSLRTVYGTDDFSGAVLQYVFGIVDYKVVGIDYYYDNTILPEMVFTQSGYETASALAYFAKVRNSFGVNISIKDNQPKADENNINIGGSEIFVSFESGDGVYFIFDKNYGEYIKEFEKIKNSGDIPGYDYTVDVSLSGIFTDYRYFGNDNSYQDRYFGDVDYKIEPSYGTQSAVTSKFDGYTSIPSVSSALNACMEVNGYRIVLSPDIISDFMSEHYYSRSYTQASLFFANDREANAAVGELKSLGYTPVPSDSIDEGDEIDVILKMLSLIFEAFGWVISVVFISLFLGLCSTRAMLATKGDVAILRSMGISAPVIRISIYVQTLIALIPAYIVTAVASVVVFTLPETNALFGFLHTGEYVVIAIALFAIALLLSKRYVKKMFGISVRKTLKGDA